MRVRDEETGAPRELDIRCANGDLKSRLLTSLLKKELIRCIPQRLFDEILADYERLVEDRDEALDYLETQFCGALGMTYMIGLRDICNKMPINESVYQMAFDDFKATAGICEYYAPTTQWREDFENAWKEETPEITLQLMQVRRDLQKENRRISRAITNYMDLFWFDVEDDCEE